MRFDNPFSDEEIRRAGAVRTTQSMAMDAHFWGVDACVRFMKEFMPPGLNGYRPKSAKDAAVLDIHTAVCGFVGCISRLRGDWGFQGIAACSRSIFELYNDLLLLTQEPTDLPARRYHAFISVERLSKARKRLQFFLQHPEAVEPETITQLQEFVLRHGPPIDNEAKALWEQWPQHWSGIRSTEARARSAGLDCEVLYFQFYSILSWVIHTASVGTVGLTADTLIGQVARALELVRSTVPTVFGIVATELCLDIPGLNDKVSFLKHAFFLRLVAVKLGAPERFNIRDRPN